MASATREATRLEISRVYAASPERVFAAWTQPEALKRWFAPSPRFSLPAVELDLRIGGAYRLELQPAGGDALVVRGHVPRDTPARAARLHLALGG